uniref:hypothetical protein n=1 Tax=Trametes maxima TaxID=259368 RepID=UPI003002C346|nr:hypothetical protein [Trametes maxima]
MKLKMQNQFNNTLHNLRLALKKANSISLLPRKVEVYYNYLYMRIFRVLGGICLVLVLTGKFSLFGEEIHIFIFILALIQSFLIIIINLIKFFYGLYVIIKKPNIFEVRNSPFNYLSTHLTRLVYTVTYARSNWKR